MAADLRIYPLGKQASAKTASTFNYLDPAERPRFVRGWKTLWRYVRKPAAHKLQQQRHAAQHGSDLGVPGIGLTRDHLLLVVSA